MNNEINDQEPILYRKLLSSIPHNRRTPFPIYRIDFDLGYMHTLLYEILESYLPDNVIKQDTEFRDELLFVIADRFIEELIGEEAYVLAGTDLDEELLELIDPYEDDDD